MFAALAGSSSAAVLYAIPSFDATDATVPVSTTVQYVPNAVTVNVAAGLTGPDANQLNTLQTINSAASTGLTGLRFQNGDSDVAQTNGTLILDVTPTVGAGYLQFGVSGGILNLTSLTFDAKKATANTTAVRGYSVSVSVNGGAYSLLGTDPAITADRNAAPFNNISLPLSAAAYQGINSVDFRVSSIGGGIEYTNFAINGAVAVPEPAAPVLAAGLLGGVVFLRRRRRD